MQASLSRSAPIACYVESVATPDRGVVSTILRFWEPGPPGGCDLCPECSRTEVAGEAGRRGLTFCVVHTPGFVSEREARSHRLDAGAGDWSGPPFY